MSDEQPHRAGGSAPGAGTTVDNPRPLGRRDLISEMLLVLGVSVGASALRSGLSLVDSLTVGRPLSQQSRSLVISYTPDRPWLDLAHHLVAIGLALVPVALVVHLLARSGEGRRAIGFDASQPGRDLLRGAVVAAVVGGIGLLVYIGAYQAGFSVRIAAVTAEDRWYTVPVLLLSALENGVLEEVIVLGYLLHRLAQLGVRPWRAIGISALLRGSYHLYQGFGGFFGNLAMGILFGILYRRWGRCMPLVVAHTLIDAVAFVGYFYLRGTVSWLP